ncbi:hypothetical protein TNCV_967871 [Trichonephila clavipes]|nr:hypothetical protein TNCV_967871 [Trichonephila clavipes]
MFGTHSDDALLQDQGLLLLGEKENRTSSRMWNSFLQSLRKSKSVQTTKTGAQEVIDNFFTSMENSIAAYNILVNSSEDTSHDLAFKRTQNTFLLHSHSPGLRSASRQDRTE